MLIEVAVIDKVNPKEDVKRMGRFHRRKNNISWHEWTPMYEQLLVAKKQYLCTKEMSNSFTNTPMSEAYNTFLEALKLHYIHVWLMYFGPAAHKHIKELGLNEIDVID